jgi:hypothetical protein
MPQSERQPIRTHSYKYEVEMLVSARNPAFNSA